MITRHVGIRIKQTNCGKMCKMYKIIKKILVRLVRGPGERERDEREDYIFGYFHLIKNDKITYLDKLSLAGGVGGGEGVGGEEESRLLYLIKK